MNNTHLTIILNEMCRRVGTSLNQVNVKQQGWYTQKQWSAKEEKLFKEWMITYVMYQGSVRKELFNSSRYRPKKEIEKFVTYFIMDKGWKTIH